MGLRIAIPGTKRVLALAALLVVASGAYYDGGDAAAAFTAELQFVLGADEGDGPVFGDVVNVATDQQGRIFVADRQTLNIKVFDEEGDHITTIGRPGRGPGEFRYIDVVGTIGPSEIVAVDFLQRRATVFSSEGEVVDTYTSTSLADRSVHGDIHPVGDKILSALNVKDGALFHTYDRDSLRHIRSFGSPSLAGNDGSKYMDRFSTSYPGHSCAGASGSVFYTPTIYREKVYRFSPVAGEWSVRDTLEGRVDADSSPASEPFQRADTPEEGFYLKDNDWENYWSRAINFWSIGVLCLSEGKVAHFTHISEGDEKYISLNVFSEQGTLLKSGRVAGLDLSTWSEPYPRYFVEAVASDDTFYVLDMKDFDTVRAVEIKGL
jgi:hypothetical protein